MSIELTKLWIWFSACDLAPRTRAWKTRGPTRAIRPPRITMTTMSSTSVKPRRAAVRADEAIRAGEAIRAVEAIRTVEGRVADMGRTSGRPRGRRTFDAGTGVPLPR